MKLKRTNIFIALLIISISIFIIIGYHSIRKNEKSITVSSLEAIPLDASIIIQSPSMNELLKLTKTNNLVKNILKNPNLKQLNSQIKLLDSLSNTELNNIFSSKKITISIHQLQNKNEILYCLKLSGKTKRILSNYIQNNLKIDTIGENRYSNAKIIKINNKIYASFIDNNLFILSNSSHLINSAIIQQQSKNPISLDIGFKEITKLAENKIHIFLNYKHLPDFFKNIVKYRSKSNKLKKIAYWSGLNLNITENNISLTGYTSSKTSGDLYLDMFANIPPAKNDFFDIIPAKTNELFAINSKDMYQLMLNYEKYLTTKNLSDNYNKYIESLKFNLSHEFFPYMEKNIIFFSVLFNSATKNYSHFLIIKYKKKNKLFEKLQTNISCDTCYTIIETTSKNFKIYKLNKPDFTKQIFGKFFPVGELPYVLNYKENIIFSQSPEDFQNLLLAINHNNTLPYNSDFQKISSIISPVSNILYLSNNNFNIKKILLNLNEENKKTATKFLNSIKKSEYFTIQYTYSNKKTFATQINIFYTNNPALNGMTVWEKKIKCGIRFKPLFFKNHYTFQKEIVVVDSSNTIYLFDNKGKALWQKRISDSIIAMPEMIDIYNNGKYQLLISTKHYLATVDRNGKLVSEKQTKLPEPATLGTSVIDYDGNKNYRFFVTTKNKIYLFDKDFKQVEGWKIPKTTTNIVSKVYHFLFQGKDYLVFAEKSGIHILNRKGQTRVSPRENFEMPQHTYFYFQNPSPTEQASFVTTDASGSILKIDLNGNVKKNNLVKLSAKHFFIAADLNGDLNLDYILADKNILYVFNSNGKQMFTYTFDKNITFKPSILKFSSTNIKIGIVTADDNKIYIFNTDGTIADNFPVPGNSPFSVGLLGTSKNFNLIVGNHNFLLRYLVY